VNAVQEDKVIFSMNASFHIEEPGPEHQDLFPEEALALLDQYDKLGSSQTQGEKRLTYGNFETTPNIREIMTGTLPKSQSRGHWFRATDAVPASVNYQQAALAYISDLGPTGAMVLPHGLSLSRDIQAASLDHALWFHSNDFDIQDWLYCSLHSDRAHGARGLSRGSIFNRDGKLIASLAQEGLIRPRQK
jgi:acyl-CoA thioesterase-2